MDNIVLEKINNLTNGVYAQEYFTKRGLNFDDAVKIREKLKDDAIKEQLDSSMIEIRLNFIINKYCYDKNLTKTMENDINNSYEEKLMIYKLNSNKNDILCTNCKKELIKEFNYCPYCGTKNKDVTLKLVTEGNVDLTKGYITPEEIQHVRFLTPEEESLVKEGKLKFEEAGIALDETNSPYEIKKLLISRDEKLRNDSESRKNLYDENLRIHKKQIVNYQLSVFEDSNKIRNIKVYPPSVMEEKNEEKDKIIEKDGETPLVKPGERRRKYIKIVSKPSKSKTKERLKEEKTDNQVDEYQKPVEDLKINLKYAGILYLKDAIKHPKNPQIPNDMLYWLNLSSISEVTQYLRKNELITDAKGMDLIKANLKELTQKEITELLSANGLRPKKSRDENINIICENIDRQKLEQYRVQNAVHVTKRGYDFVRDNPQVETYSNYLYNFRLKAFEQLYQESKGDSLTDIALGYLINIREYYSQKMKWNKFALTYEAESRIYSDKNDKTMQLNAYVRYFICMINPWDDNKLSYENPIRIGNNEELIKIVDKSKLSFRQVEDMFIEEAERIQLPGLFLLPRQMFDYFKRIYENDDIRVINNELTEKYDLKSLDKSNLEFYTKKEQEEVYKNVKKLFN